MPAVQTTPSKPKPSKPKVKSVKPASNAKRGKKGSSGKGSKKLPLAVRADKHICYQLSVQSVDAEIDFVDDTYKDLRGRHAASIREDFCGTANSATEWVKRRRANTAIAVDLDQATLDWGAEHNVENLTPSARKRIKLVRKDVRTVRSKTDIVLAMNFSYYCFKTRDELRGYFENVRRGLEDGGLFIMDCYGGSEAHAECKEKREINDEFTYVWEQARFSPITGDMNCFIHFHFADGSKMNKAFEYSWRMWTLPELRELLAEAGFSRSTVYWEGTDEETNEGNGEFEPDEVGDADPAWIAYVVAEK